MSDPVVDFIPVACPTSTIDIANHRQVQLLTRPKTVRWVDSEEIHQDGGPASKKRKLCHISEVHSDVAASHIPPRNRRKQQLAVQAGLTTNVVPSPGGSGGHDSPADANGGSTANQNREKHVHYPIASTSATSHDESDALGSKIASLVHYIQDVASQATRYRHETTRRAVVTEIRHQETLDDIKCELSIAKDFLLKERQAVECLTEERNVLKNALQLEREDASKLAERIAQQRQVDAEERDTLRRTLQIEREQATELAQKFAQEQQIVREKFNDTLKRARHEDRERAEKAAWERHLDKTKIVELSREIAQLKESLSSQQEESAKLTQGLSKMEDYTDHQRMLYQRRSKRSKGEIDSLKEALALERKKPTEMRTNNTLQFMDELYGLRTLWEVPRTRPFYCARVRKEYVPQISKPTMWKTPIQAITERFHKSGWRLRPEEVAPHIVKKEFMDVVENLDFFQQPTCLDNLDSRLLEFSVRVVERLAEFEFERA